MITPGEIAAHIKGATEDDYGLLEELRDAALAFLSESTSRYFGPIREVTEWVHGFGTSSLWLDDTPEGEAVVRHDGEELNGWTLRGERLVRDRGVWWPEKEYEVTYSQGYTSETLPPDIRQAVIDLIATRWTQKGREGLQSETIGGYSYTVAQGGNSDGWTITDMVERTIRNWRKVRI
jgi:hypothetical protein